MHKFNYNEKNFIEILENVKRYVKGELELDDHDGEWFAMDYRADLQGAFYIDVAPYDKPLIIDEEAERKEIDIWRCCDYCNVSIVR